ncbi:hypothetical protein ACI2KE_01030 [Pseudomonas monteilii]
MICRLEHFSRNKTIEKTVDRAMALHEGSLKSICVFLDLLDELLNEFNASPERHNLLKMQRYLRYKGEIHNHSAMLDILGKAEQDYMLAFEAYLQDIREKLQMSHGTTWDIIKNTKYYIQHEISLNELSNSQLKEKIEIRLNSYSTFYYGLVSQGENLAIVFEHPRTILYVVRSWADYAINTGKHNVHLIVDISDEASIPSDVITQGNIITVALKNERGRFNEFSLSNSIQHCIRNIQTASAKLNGDDSEEAKIRSELETCLERLFILRRKFRETKRSQGHLFLEDLKLTRKYVEVSIDRTFNNHPERLEPYRKVLEEIHSILSGMWDAYVSELDLSAYIHNSLLEIKRNDGLYRLMNSDTSLQNRFREDNLTAILASMLRAAYYKHSRIVIQREAYIGSGRADIKITNNGKTIGIIESKLVTDNFAQKIYEGLHQLFKRYSENDVMNEGSAIDLHLVIFSYDREFGAIAQHIEKVVNKYSSDKSITCHKHESSENSLHFSYAESRETYGFLNKSRNITIHLCNMEVDYKSKLLASVRQK